MSIEFLQILFILLVTACVTVSLSNALKLGSVIGYLIAGILIGPFVFGFIKSPEKIIHIAEFGVVMMLFLIGLELSPKLLWEQRKSLLGLGGMQVFMTSAAFTLIFVAFGYAYASSLAIGMTFALSSTALVMQILKERNQTYTPLGNNSFMTLLFQDIAVIPILVLLPFLATSASGLEDKSLITNFNGWVQVLIIFSVIALVVLAGKYLAKYLFIIVAKSRQREVFTALSLAMVIGVSVLMQAIGLSQALGAFIAGIFLANSEYKKVLETEIEPFKGLLLGLFFMAVGMGIDFSYLKSDFLGVLSYLFLLITVKTAILYLISVIFNMPKIHRLAFALILAQGGEFAFVLLQLMGQLSLLSTDEIKKMTLVVALSISITPIIMFAFYRFIMPRLCNDKEERPFNVVNEHNPVIIVGFGRFGQIIGRFLISQGVQTTILDNDPDEVEMIGKFGHKAFYGDATRLDLMRTAGAEEAHILVLALDNVESSLEIVKMVNQYFPHLKIYARARNRRHALELHSLGVKNVRREVFASSLELAEEIMYEFGKSPSYVKKKLTMFRNHDEETLQKQMEFRDDEEGLMKFAKSSREELNAILAADLEENAELKKI